MNGSGHNILSDPSTEISHPQSKPYVRLNKQNKGGGTLSVSHFACKHAQDMYAEERAHSLN